MPETTYDENKLLSPAEAVDFLNRELNAEITVDILRQMRRKGRVIGTPFGAGVGKSRTTVYRIGDLLQADITRYKAGRPKTKQKES